MKELKREAKYKEKLKKLQFYDNKDQEYHLKAAQNIRDILEGRKKLGSTDRANNQDENQKKIKGTQQNESIAQKLLRHRQAQNTIYQTGQKRLAPISEEEERRNRHNFLAREGRSNAKNFIVLDTETSGFPRDGGGNEPIQIAAIIFKKGKETKSHFNEIYQIEGKITKSAQRVHGLTKKMLKDKLLFSKGAAERLKNFLNKEKTFPIIAHFAKYDRDDVLKPAFNRVDVTPIDDKRWKCTRDMANKHPGVPQDMPRGLDDLLEHFGFNRRDEEEKHNALDDCRMDAKVYLELCKKVKAEGFVENEAGKSELEEMI